MTSCRKCAGPHFLGTDDYGTYRHCPRCGIYEDFGPLTLPPPTAWCLAKPDLLPLYPIVRPYTRSTKHAGCP